ncbi:hypothetical protein VQY16_02700 [Mesomycoplasma ovipneumoniae]|uniref:hypothetical protein n=1 Tax=Mesomycoplasma ovipneumoniae TaxID=29562 RepID=UPI0029642CFF|nr:hypothetical protein [Mesomycoplasma ovipneumoniae]
MSINKIKVYSHECFKILPAIKEESIDMIFADPAQTKTYIFIGKTYSCNYLWNWINYWVFCRCRHKLVVAYRTNRNAIGIEQEKKYVDIINKRLNKELNNGK